MRQIKFKRFRHKANCPRRATVCSAGYDLFSAEKIVISTRSVTRISTYIGMQIDRKLVGKICSRLSLPIQQIKAGPSVIDSDYRGIIYVVLHNLSEKPFVVNVGDKIVQLLFEKISLLVLVEVLEFDDITDRGHSGFGSTGIIYQSHNYFSSRKKMDDLNSGQ